MVSIQLMSLFLVRNIAESGCNKNSHEDISPVKRERPLKFGSLEENPSLFIASGLPLMTNADIFYKIHELNESMSPLQSPW